ncbi:hypothetical protein DH09_15300 [Bacillaceae bacterium JMAK1]|nr:hypothetical protein DH09_15300 [Bacillaceae bacterium JMAK1]
MQTRTLIMVEIALMTALALILDRIEFSGPWVMGGSITLVMLPIFVMAFRRGVKVGVATGLLVGTLKLVLGSSIFHPVQALLDYPVAFAVVGLAGLFTLRNTKGELAIKWAIVGLFVASFLRLFVHIISGVIWFGAYTPEGWNVWIYSIVYNASYIIPATLITFAVIFLISKAQPSFFKKALPASKVDNPIAS